MKYYIRDGAGFEETRRKKKAAHGMPLVGENGSG